MNFHAIIRRILGDGSADTKYLKKLLLEDNRAMESHELAIFFDLKEASRRKYDAEAWETFMRHSDPEMLKNSKLFHGEVSGLLPGTGRMFCIAIRTKDPMVIRYLKDVFASSDDKRLAPPHDRIRESDVVHKYELKHRGQVDSKGRLETEKWSRVDHDLCLATGWPYAPDTYPKHISNELVDELEKMQEPGLRSPVARGSSAGLKSVPGAKSSGGTGIALPRMVATGVVAAIAVGLLLFGWLTKDKVINYVRERRENLSTKLEMGSEAYGKLKEGFALAGIAKIPHDLNLAELNEKLADRAYYVLQHKDESIFDVWMDCMVWFAANEKRDPLPQTTVQAFIKINMRSLDGSPLWTCQSKGVRNSPGTEKENPNLRRHALRAAIDGIDFSCLPDGKSVKSFQANNDFPGLSKHVEYLLAQHEDNTAVASARASTEGKTAASARAGRRARRATTASRTSEKNVDPRRAQLEAKLCGYIQDKWIMTNYVHLKNGKKLTALILEEKGATLGLRLKGGKTNIARNRIEKIEHFGREQFAENINKLLEPLKKDFQHEWEYSLCEKFVDELTEKCIVYGPPFPGACLLSIQPGKKTGDLKAVVKTAKTRKVLGKGDDISGFKVIGIDAETNSVLVRMGEKGDILRIWPKTGT